MIRLRHLFCSVCHLSKISFLFALMICTEGYLIRQGKDFIIAFCKTKRVESAGIIFQSVEEKADLLVQVSAPLLKDFRNVIFTSEHSGKFLSISKKVISTYYSLGRHGVRIRSSHDIILEGYVTASENVGGFLAIPVSSLGLRYLVITYCPNHLCIFKIVGTSDATSIKINLRVKNGGFANLKGMKYKNKKRVFIKLNTFETIRVFSNNDLSGTEIVSSNPVAVFCGGDYIKAIITWGDSGHDLIVEQLPPISALGTRYIPLPFPFPKVSETVTFLLKIVSVYDGTVIRLGNKYIRMYKGESKEILLESSSSSMLDGILSNKPVLLAEISPSWPAFKSLYSKKHNDASMIILEPLDMSKPFQQQAVATVWYGGIVPMVNLVFLRPAVCHKEALTLENVHNELSILVNPKWEVRVLYDVSEFTLVSTNRCPVLDGFMYRTGSRAGGAAGLPLVRNASVHADPGHEENFLERCPNIANQLPDWVLPSRANKRFLQTLYETK